MESAVNFLPGKMPSFLPVGRLDPAPADRSEHGRELEQSTQRGEPWKKTRARWRRETDLDEAVVEVQPE
jgi:hypothetical protein